MGKRRVKIDLTGQQFGRLVVLEQADDYISPSGNHQTMWLCECSCPEKNKIIVRGSHLKDGFTQSCGCLHREMASEANKKTNTYILDGEYGIGFASNTGSEFYFDLEDYDKIKDYCWCESVVSNNFHKLTANVNGKTTSMHILLGFKGFDHIDRNELNNKKSNLRECTHQENSWNRSLAKNNQSGVIGVYWYKDNKKWRAEVHINKKHIYVYYGDNKEDAIKARLEAEAKYYGKFAPQIHLFEQYGIIQQNDLTEEEDEI